VYIAGTLLILGMNPRSIYRKHLKQKEEELAMMAQQKVDLDGKIEQIATLNGEIQCEECTEIREHLVMQLF